MTPFQEAVTSVLRNPCNLSGRAARTEFWWFALAALVVYIITGLVPGASWVVGPVLALLLLAVGVRRLHDTGRTGWWIIPLYIPVLGAPIAIILTLWTRPFLGGSFSAFLLMAVVAMELAVLAMLALPGTRGPNRYGPDPLQPEAESLRERAETPMGPASAISNRWIGKTLIAAAVAAAMLIAMSLLFSPGGDAQDVDLATLLAMAQSGQITSIAVDGDRLIAVNQVNQEFIATKSPGVSIFEILQSAGIDPVERGIEVEVKSRSGLENQLVQYLPLTFFIMMLAGISVVLFLLLSRRR